MCVYNLRAKWEQLNLSFSLKEMITDGNKH